MYCQPDWYLTIYQLQQQLSTQAIQLQRLQKTIAVLQNEIEQLKKNPTTKVEKIEYKFDQLKIETLEGTLNIGLNPNDLHSIEDFAIQNDAMNIHQPILNNQQVSQCISDEINSYLDGECLPIIKSLEAKYSRNLDESYHNFMINDIKKQINHRITYYMNHYASQLSDDESKYKATIIQKVKEDINQSLIAFIQNLPGEFKGGINNEFHSD